MNIQVHGIGIGSGHTADIGIRGMDIGGQVPISISDFIAISLLIMTN
jgi:hypothetical protein